MRLTELEATFIGQFHHGSGPDDPEKFHELGNVVEGEQGVLFICPKCGNHSVLCWFKNPRNAPVVPDDVFPKPGRWTFTGETIDQLSLEPSVDLSKHEGPPDAPGFCNWHGMVMNGAAS